MARPEGKAMLNPSTEAIIANWVAARLGCTPDDLHGSRTLVKAHGPRLDGYCGVYVWLMDDIAVVSAPPDWVEVVKAAVAGQTSEALHDPAFWHAALGSRVERIIGPSYQGYVDAEAFQPAAPLPGPAAPQVLRLGPADLPALERLAAACAPQEWEDSAIQPDHAPIFAAVRAGELLAAASAPDDVPAVASVGVITHPAWRGRGYGATVVSALTADRLASGVILHYQTLRANAASVAVARALGYHDVATALGVRLRE
jgi:hypothetical protein